MIDDILYKMPKLREIGITYFRAQKKYSTCYNYFCKQTSKTCLQIGPFIDDLPAGEDGDWVSQEREAGSRPKVFREASDEG